MVAISPSRSRRIRTGRSLMLRLLFLLGVEIEGAASHLLADRDELRHQHRSSLPVRAVDDQGVTGDEAREGGGEKGRGPSELVGLADPMGRAAEGLALAAIRDRADV